MAGILRVKLRLIGSAERLLKRADRALRCDQQRPERGSGGDQPQG